MRVQKKWKIFDTLISLIKVSGKSGEKGRAINPSRTIQVICEIRYGIWKSHVGFAMKKPSMN
jgi:hypothetical protein